MKNYLTTLSIIFCMSSQLIAQYDVNNPKILAEKNGYTYTEGMFQQGLQFTEFVLDARLENSDLATGKAQAIRDFLADPAAFTIEAQQLDKTMQQVYAMTEVLTIAGVRSSLMCQLFLALQVIPENLFLSWVEKYNPVLAYDQQLSLVFCEKDFLGTVEMARFQTGLSGQSLQLTNTDLTQLRADYVQHFLQGDENQRRLLSVMGTLTEYTLASYERLSESDRKTLHASLPGHPNSQGGTKEDDFLSIPDMPDYSTVTWPTGVDTPEEKKAYLAKRRSAWSANQSALGILNDVSLNNHALMLNMVENMGSTGDYWQIKYQ